MRHIAVALVLVMSRVAAADDGRLAAEQLAQEAMRTRDVGKLVACGQAYLDLYNKDPARTDGDEVLYNAAICFQQGRSVASAILAWQLVLRAYPSSRLGSKATMQLAMTYEGIAMFDEAAARFEDYEKRYAGEKDARDALENAIFLRTALADRDRRIADTKEYVRTYGAKAPKEAADAAFAVVGAYDTPADQVKVLREYLKTYGGKGGREQLAAAYQRLGDALWRQSCPVKPIDGLCARVAHDTAQHCSDAVRLEVVPRLAARKEALAAYDQAIKIVSEAGLDDPASRHAAAMARLAHGDDLLETMLANKLPAVFDEKKLSAWLTAETRAGEAANRAYEEVLAAKDPAASVAAAARMGQVSDQFSATLVASAIPATVRTGAHAAEKVKAYCDQMTVVAEPLHQRAQEAFGVCAQKSVELGVFDDWTALCRRQIHTTIAEIQPELTLAIPVADGGKPYSAPLGLAIANLGKLRAMARTDPARKPLASEVQFQARSALAVGSDVLPYVVLAMTAVEEGEQLDVARAMIDEGLRADDKSPVLYAARAVIDARRGNWTLAWASAERAMAVDPKSDVSLRISGLVAAHVGAFDTASERLAKLKDQTYDVVLARAIAARGLGDAKAAEALYTKAIGLDPKPTEAQRDLDLLHDPSLGR